MLQVLTEAESKQHEIDTWNAMAPGRLVQWQDRRCREMPTAIVVERGDQVAQVIILTPVNVERIMNGLPCETTTLTRSGAFFNSVSEPIEYTPGESLRMPSIMRAE